MTTTVMGLLMLTIQSSVCRALLKQHHQKSGLYLYHRPFIAKKGNKTAILFPFTIIQRTPTCLKITRTTYIKPPPLINTHQNNAKPYWNKENALSICAFRLKVIRTTPKQQSIIGHNPI